MMQPKTLLPASIAVLLFAYAAAIGAQTPGTVWAGVYTADQAARGKVTYDESCSGCHGPYLEGFRSTGSAKALAREPFMDRWDGGTVDELYQFIVANMPKSTAATGSSAVSPDAKVDIVAYILQVNEFPAGSSRLTASGMVDVRIQSKEGVKPPKNGMTVQAVGCVTQADGKWLLTRATDPLRARSDALSTGAERTANGAKSGAATVELVDPFPEPAEFKGQKIEVKGLFVAGKIPGINLLDLQKVADSCN